jgi:pimeloyl-ACP methyl ester carboxylesterase
MNTTLTILVHGFNKNSRDMDFLKKGLSESGFTVVSVDLPARFGTFEQCVEEMHLQIGKITPGYGVVNYVAHSMGGLIAREYISSTRQENVGSCVFIATPHKGDSRLAGIAGRIPFYSRIFKTVKPILPESRYVFPGLPEGVSLGLIAGNRNSHWLGSIFLPVQSDGRIEVSSVETRDADEFIVLPYGHKEIHHQQETLDLVRDFLLKRTFVKS